MSRRHLTHFVERERKHDGALRLPSSRLKRELGQNVVVTRSGKRHLAGQPAERSKSRRGTSELLEKKIVYDTPPDYVHIERNEFVHRGHKQQRQKQQVEDDIPVCACKYLIDDPESACGDQCLNALTSTECTPGYCPCGEFCKNQRFQRREYIKSKLVKTDERGWGLLADQHVKAGQFVIEYCGEVISCEEARGRSQVYEMEGVRDAYIISLSRSESIDATKKGSLARFINHSCEPNCETRKWTVLGEVRVGIFTKQEIEAGTELTYNYNFEWYGGAKVRCHCGAASCVGFLGAKSRGFQDDAYVWEDDDERFSVENVPLYDSEDDEPLSNFLKRAQVCNKLKKAGSKNTTVVSSHLVEDAHEMAAVNGSETGFSVGTEKGGEKQASTCPVETNLPQEGVAAQNNIEFDGNSTMNGPGSSKNTGHLLETGHIMVQEESAGGSRVKDIEDNEDQKRDDLVVEERKLLDEHLSLPRKRRKLLAQQPLRNHVNKHVNARSISEFLLSKVASGGISAAEEAEEIAAAELDRTHEELRPTVEEHGKDGQDNLPIALTEKWISATCKHIRTVFDLHFSVVRQLSCMKAVTCGPDMSSHMANGISPVHGDT